LRENLIEIPHRSLFFQSAPSPVPLYAPTVLPPLPYDDEYDFADHFAQLVIGFVSLIVVFISHVVSAAAFVWSIYTACLSTMVLTLLFVLVLLVMSVLTFLYYRWANRPAYAQYFGVWWGDNEIASYFFPTLTGSEGPWSWTYLGDQMYHIRGPSCDRVVPGHRTATQRRWLGPFVQGVRVGDSDDECPLLRAVAYDRPRLVWYFLPEVSEVVQSVDTACMYHPKTDTIELCWLGAAKSHMLPAGVYRAASARYRLASVKAFGVVSVALQSATRDESVVAMAMSIIKLDVDFATAGLPDLDNQPLYIGSCPEDAKPMGIRPVSSVVYPISGFGTGSPMISHATEADTINRRIAVPRSDYVGDETTVAYAHEFLQHVCGEVKLNPCDMDRVEKQMDRPSQKSNRRSVDTIMDIIPKSVKQLFTKREPVPIGNPARNICTVSPQRLYRAARFTLTASDHMQSFVWWVWGAGSGETARKYQRSCSTNNKMQESDFSKFDASLGPFWLWFNRQFMYRLFPDHVAEIDELLADSEWQTVMTTLRQRFDYGCGRFSGVNETALFNTLDQAFVQYTSFRRFGLTVEGALKRLDESLFGGDDGIVPYIGQDLPASAAVFGMKVTYRVFENDSPCRFLGRIYFNGSASADSVQDIADWLANLHLVSCAGNISTAQALVNTATGLWVTDSKTPLIREFCMSVFRAYPNLSKNIHRNDEWWFSHFNLNDPFPLDDYSDETVIITHFATVMGVDPAGLYALRDWFIAKPFYVGSRLPTLEIAFAPSLKCSYQIYGIPFGAPDVSPPLPKLKRREVKAIMERLPPTVIEPMTAEEKSITVALFGAQDCFNCGMSGHKAAACPMKITCHICNLPGHASKDCVDKEERAASEILSFMGLDSATAPTPRARGGASRGCK